jgi:ssDNA-binding Zn-finger/Zn-ribbon topoisomerase 1
MEQTAFPDKLSYVYVLTNISMPGIVKIGYTTKNPEYRANELSKATGVPTQYRVERKYAFLNQDDARTEERRLHRLLRNNRINTNREFFKISAEEIDLLISGNIKFSRHEGKNELLCPRCNSPMVLRTARKGRHAGSRFWGCHRYPLCKGVIDYHDQACQTDAASQQSLSVVTTTQELRKRKHGWLVFLIILLIFIILLSFMVDQKRAGSVSKEEVPQENAEVIGYDVFLKNGKTIHCKKVSRLNRKVFSLIDDNLLINIPVGQIKDMEERSQIKNGIRVRVITPDAF